MDVRKARKILGKSGAGCIDEEIKENITTAKFLAEIAVIEIRKTFTQKRNKFKNEPKSHT